MRVSSVAWAPPGYIVACSCEEAGGGIAQLFAWGSGEQAKPLAEALLLEAQRGSDAVLAAQ
eukprot:5687962-Alexandrium_andersonii.AAC.1